MSHLILIIFIAKVDLLATLALCVLITVVRSVSKRHPVTGDREAFLALALLLVGLPVDNTHLIPVGIKRHWHSDLSRCRLFRLEPVIVSLMQTYAIGAKDPKGCSLVWNGIAVF